MLVWRKSDVSLELFEPVMNDRLSVGRSMEVWTLARKTDTCLTDMGMRVALLVPFCHGPNFVSWIGASKKVVKHTGGKKGR